MNFANSASQHDSTNVFCDDNAARLVIALSACPLNAEGRRPKPAGGAQEYKKTYNLNLSTYLLLFVAFALFAKRGTFQMVFSVAACSAESTYDVVFCTFLWVDCFGFC